LFSLIGPFPSIGSPSGADIRSGTNAAGGMYDNVGTGYSKVHKSATTVVVPDIGAFGASGTAWTSSDTVATAAEVTGLNARWIDYDSKISTDVENAALDYCFAFVSSSEVLTKIPGADLRAVDQLAIVGFTTANGVTNWDSTYQGGQGVKNLRKLNQRGNWNYLTSTFTPDHLNGTHVLFVIAVSNTGAVPAGPVTMSAAIADTLTVNTDGSALTLSPFESDFATPPTPAIPEVEIIEARLSDIFELAGNHLKRQRRSELLPAGIIITGGGAHIGRIEELAKSQLKLPCRVGPIDNSINNKLKIRDWSWYTAFGLALSQGDGKANNDMNMGIQFPRKN
jgi:hypothetical protein